MAAIHGKDGTLTFNAVALSTNVTEWTLTVEADLADVSTFGSTYRSRVAGLKDWNVSANFMWSGSASEVDQTLFPLIGTSATIALKVNSGATAATNPSYGGAMFLESYEITTPVDGAVEASCQFAGNGTLTRSTS